jgi:hypothetical protein
LVRELVYRVIELPNIPQNATIDPEWYWHPAVGDELIEFGRAHSDIEGGVEAP